LADHHSAQIISFIGLGSNMENPAARCMEAIQYIETIEGCNVLRRSSFYRTEPVGLLDQDWFVNAVIEIRTAFSARVLMQQLQAIENKMGRQKSEKWGPRIIDLDILLYGQDIIKEDKLTIPHPEFHSRRFVLVPLEEIAPYVIHPAFGVSVAGLMDRLEDTSRVELLNIPIGFE
jgi:2-amino-4-hydroxy-6-hydroxymethyldihydropteridine diphosphokinase